MAQRHVAQARQIIVHQHERIDALRRDGHSTARAEECLALFVATLKAFEDFESRLGTRRCDREDMLRDHSLVGFRIRSRVLPSCSESGSCDT
jgi:hypothetical protein